MRYADMSRDTASALKLAHERAVNKGLGDPLERSGSLTGALLRCIEQLAVEVEAANCRVAELEEWVEEQKAWAADRREL